MSLRGFRLINLVCKLFRQRLGIHRHGVTARSASRHTSGDGDPGEGIARLVALPCEPRNHANGGIVLVEGGGELLARAGQLLLDVESLKGERVPLVLEGREQRGYGSERGRPRADDARCLELEQVGRCDVVVRDGVFAVLLDVLFNESLLEYGACWKDSCLSEWTSM